MDWAAEQGRIFGGGLTDLTGSETLGHVGGAAAAGISAIPAGIAGAGLSLWDWLTE